ncbi:MAG TPA: PspC domain-containing protein [Chloroflexota bacterium]|jgi:phage shock protein PspC (stress-responsive transcriptional regulator)
MHRLTRSAQDRVLAGVAGGLGEYLGVDPTIVRLAWVLAAFLTGGVAILIYLAFWLIMPRVDRVQPYL